MSITVARASLRLKFWSSLNASTEVLALLLIGSVLTGLILGAVVPPNITPDLKAYAEDPQRYGPLNTYVLAGMTAFEQLVEFTLILVPAFVLGRLRYRAPARAYRLTLNGAPLYKLVLMGVLLFCVASLPSTAVHLAHTFFSFGEGARHWRYLEELPRDFGYFLFMLAGDVLLPPLFEETWARGYTLTRLVDVFGPAAAILLTALFFCLAHTQYLIVDAYAIAILLSSLFFSAALGYVAYRTGSLVPPLVAHSLVNSPLNSPFHDHRWIQTTFVVMLIVVAMYRRAILTHIRDFLALFRRPDFSLAQFIFGCLVIAGVMLTDALGGSFQDRLVGMFCLCVALATGIVLRRHKYTRDTA